MLHYFTAFTLRVCICLYNFVIQLGYINYTNLILDEII